MSNDERSQLPSKEEPSDKPGKEDSAQLKALLAMIEADELGLLSANWDDASSGASSSDLRKALMRAIALGRLDIVEMMIEKMGIEMVLSIIPDGLAMALAKTDVKMLRMMIRRGFLRRSARRNAKLLAEANVFGALPDMPALSGYASRNGSMVAVAFLQGSMIMLALSEGGVVTSVFSEMTAASESGIDVSIGGMRDRELIEYCREHAPSLELDTVVAESIQAVEALDMTAAEVGIYPLHEAVLDNDMSQVESLVGAGMDVNARDEAGNTALMMAARVGNSEATEMLLGAGADPMLVNERGQSALSISKEMGETAQHEVLAHAAVSQEIEREMGRRQMGAQQQTFQAGKTGGLEFGA